MNRLIIFMTALSLGLAAQDGKKGNVLTDAGDAAKLVLAKQKLLGGQYISALNLYREVLNRNPKDADTKYYLGLCQFNLQKYAEARQTLEEAQQLQDVKPETYLVLGKLYQMSEEYDKAISALAKYKASGPTDTETLEESDLLLEQCNNAVNFMKSPANVKVENLGPGINSPYDDKNPCISADGRNLIFTTRRPETTSAPTDVEGDGRYFENIYIASPDSSTMQFTKASGVSKTINTDAHDACTSISPDGTQIFIYRNDNSREALGGNVFVSKVSGGKWRKPMPLGKPINSTYWEGGVCVSPDGRKYFFSSEREGGFGNSDIWMVEKTGKDEWGKPVNLGGEVNSPYDEAGMFLAPDGKTLFFCSNGPRSMGNYDVLRTVYENGRWSTPQNLGYPINTSAKEGQLTISADAGYAYISSSRKGGIGESDIYRIDLSDFAILEKDFKKKSTGLCILRGTIREGNEGYGIPDVSVSVKNEKGEVFNATTGETGEYFYTLPAGRYTLTVSKKGYEEITEAVTLEPAESGKAVAEKGYLLKRK